MTTSALIHANDNRMEIDTELFDMLYSYYKQEWSQGADPLEQFFTTEDHFKTRQYGVEIEFNHPQRLTVGSQCYCDCRCMGRAPLCDSCVGTCCTGAHAKHPVADFMHDNGFLDKAIAKYYHAGVEGYSQWRYEFDDTVSGGEVITPIMDGSGDSWAVMKTVMDGISALGGDARGTNAGGHISINAPEFRNDWHNMRRLIFLMDAFEDVMFRLGANPYRVDRTNTDALSHHRGTSHSRNFFDGEFERMKDAEYPWEVTFHTTRARWVHCQQDSSRVEFRIFDGSLSPALTQTWTMIASAMVTAACNRKLDAVIRQLPSRRLEWHIMNPKEDETRAIREFVNILFRTDEERERVIALFAGNDWN